MTGLLEQFKAILHAKNTLSRTREDKQPDTTEDIELQMSAAIGAYSGTSENLVERQATPSHHFEMAAKVVAIDLADGDDSGPFSQSCQVQELKEDKFQCLRKSPYDEIEHT